MVPLSKRREGGIPGGESLGAGTGTVAGAAVALRSEEEER